MKVNTGSPHLTRNSNEHACALTSSEYSTVAEDSRAYGSPKREKAVEVARRGSIPKIN